MKEKTIFMMYPIYLATIYKSLDMCTFKISRVNICLPLEVILVYKYLYTHVQETWSVQIQYIIYKAFMASRAATGGWQGGAGHWK